MSRPARAWSETTRAWASVNCSRNHGSIMAVSSGRPQRFWVYQRGRGQEPVTVAGSIRSLVAVNATAQSFPYRLRIPLLVVSDSGGGLVDSGNSLSQLNPATAGEGREPLNSVIPEVGRG